jgi:hypothetical protein
MTKRALRYCPIVIIAPALLVSGCLQPMDDFPSLARRDVELRDRQAEALAPPPAIETVTDPALARQLKGVLDKAEDAQETFAVARSAAQQAAGSARNAPVGSESWSVAQTRISTLDSSRRQLAELLGDLEVLYIARLEQEADGKVKAGGSSQIDETRQFVLQLVEAQDKVINDLKANLAG